MYEQEEEINYKAENYSRLNRFLDSLNNSTTPINIITRGEDAFAAAIKFMEILDKAIPEEEELRKLKIMWFKSIRDKDYRKFKKSLRRYTESDESKGHS